MVIGCTKKLLDFLKIKPQSAAAEADPLFGWTANLITLNRRNVLVAVNRATNCRFVLYGLTAKNISKLPDLITNGIRALLQSEYIAPEVIEKYLDDCGRELTLTTCASRSDVSYCNHACDRMKRFADLFETGSILQERFLPWINDELRGSNGNYHFVYKDLIDELTDRYGSPVQSTHAAELEVTLDLLTPCRRTLVVPSDFNFYQLHRILQHALAWQDCHLHQFVLAQDAHGRPTKVVQPFDLEDEDWFEDDAKLESIDSTTITVREVFEAQRSIEYDYDFGDGWVHTIKLKRFIPDCTEPYPHCTDAVGDAPMEDSGGPYGFYEKMKILNDPTHPEHEEISRWVSSTWWHPLDLARINRLISQKHRYCIPVQYD